MNNSFIKIVIEGSTLFTKGYTGIPNYILSLEKALKKNSNVSVLLAYHIRKAKNMKNNTTNLPYKWYLSKFLFSLSKPQISHSLHTPFLQIFGTKKIATIHDLAVHLAELDKYNFSSEYFKNKRFKLFQNFAKNADAIIAVSENTKKDFLKFFDYPEEKIHVVHLAPVFKPKETSKEQNLTVLNDISLTKNKYYLTVGGVSLRKNSFNLLKGFHLSEKHKTFKLVFAGKIIKSEKQKLDDYIHANNMVNSIVFTNYISDENLSVLYKNARAFLFPTFYEGFGIPIIEAMSYGLPVLTSITGAAPEVANNHAVLVNPVDENSIANGIIEIDNMDEEKIIIAKNYAETFTWDKVARNTIEVYKSVL